MTGDYYYQEFLRDDAAKARWLSKRPVCDYCGEPIQEDSAIYLNNEWICDSCADDFRRCIEDETDDYTGF